METVKVSSLKGGEIVAKDIILDNGILLIPKETTIKYEYIKSMEELGIERIYIEGNSKLVTGQNYLLDTTIRESMKDILKNTLEEHMYKKVLNLDNFILVANRLIKCTNDKLNNDKLNNDKLKFDIIEHSADLYEHIIQVCTISIAIAIKMNIHNDQVYDIALGSLLHDIGLRYISFNYKNCNIEDLSPNEIFEYKKHTIYGYLALEDIKDLKTEIKNLVLFHHEKMDGSGYPLKYKELDICQRILILCNTFESYISGLGCIRRTKEDTLTLLEGMSGIQYDKDVIKLISKLFY